MIDVATETVIDGPRADIVAYASDPANARQWYANIESVEWLGPPPLRLGTRLAFMRLAVRAANRKDLVRLKALLESRHA